MSAWFLSSTGMVCSMSSLSSWPAPSTSRVRAQSSVSDTDGFFFRSSSRSDLMTWASWVARAAEMPGTRASTISRSRSTVG